MLQHSDYYWETEFKRIQESIERAKNRANYHISYIWTFKETKILKLHDQRSDYYAAVVKRLLEEGYRLLKQYEIERGYTWQNRKRLLAILPSTK